MSRLSKFDSLESRLMFAFGDLDKSWDGDGILNLDRYGFYDEVRDIALQSNGQLIIGQKSANADFSIERIFLKRRLPDGSLDRSFGKNGEAEVNPYALDGDFLDEINVQGDDSIQVVSSYSGPEAPDPANTWFTSSGARTTGPGYTPPTHLLDTLSDGTVVVQETANHLYHYTGDMKTRIKWGDKDYATLPTSYEVNTAILQGNNIIISAQTGPSQVIYRIDAKTGIQDKTFGKNSSQAKNGIVTIPNLYAGVKMLDDGSLIYVLDHDDTNLKQLFVGHLLRDGLPDTTYNTASGGTAHAYSVAALGNVQTVYLDSLLIGKNGQVFVSAVYSTDSNTHGLVMKLKMPVTPSSTGKITGVLFNDNNKNKTKESNETLNVGRTVFIDTNNNGLLDNGERSMLTDSEGRYTFDGLVAGTYRIRRVLPSGYHVTDPVFATGFLTLKTGETLTANIGSTNK